MTGDVVVKHHRHVEQVAGREIGIATDKPQGALDVASCDGQDGGDYRHEITGDLHSLVVALQG